MTPQAIDFDPDQIEHEIAFIRSFVVKHKRDRMLGFVHHLTKRNLFTQELNHIASSAIDPRYLVEIPGREHRVEHLHQRLVRLGAPKDCWIMSYWNQHDGTRHTLHDALRLIVGTCSGTVLSCVPGRLAYIESEDMGERYILLKQDR